MFLVQISNELQIATDPPVFGHQLDGRFDGRLVDLIGDGETVIEMISDQVPKLIGDQFDRPSNVHINSYYPPGST